MEVPLFNYLGFKLSLYPSITQRVHHVRIDGDSVFVMTSDLSKPVESDRYFTEPYREMMENVLQEPILQPNRPVVSVPIHSTRTGLPRR